MSSTAKDWMLSKSAYAIAPAGCGKTELLIDLIKETSVEVKQLVLTHTHAGVHTIKERALRKSLPHNSFDVFTIDSLSYNFVFSFPSLSDYDMRSSEEPDWIKIRSSFLHLLQSSTYMKAHIAERWQGVIVDEYQDCSIQQHLIVAELAKIIPCRVIGDPLQGIYAFDPTNPQVDWDEHVAPTFVRINFNAFPHRWSKTSPELGEWLLKKRQEIIVNRNLDLFQDKPSEVLVYKSGDIQNVVNLALRLHYSTPKEESILIIQNHAEQCHYLAARTGGKFRSIEELEMESLSEYASKLDTEGESKWFDTILKLISKTCTGVTKEVMQLINKVVEDQPHNTKLFRASNQIFIDIARLSQENCEPSTVLSLLGLFRKLPGVKVYRRELWKIFTRAVQKVALNQASSYKSAVRSSIDQYRGAGRIKDNRVIGRIRLVKGLEYDHVIIVGIEQYKSDPREMYVALTRAKKSIHIFSDSSKFEFGRFGLPRVLLM